MNQKSKREGACPKSKMLEKKCNNVFQLLDPLLLLLLFVDLTILKKWMHQFEL
jgi:hypothetical protein